MRRRKEKMKKRGKTGSPAGLGDSAAEGVLNEEKFSENRGERWVKRSRRFENAMSWKIRG